MSEVRSCKIVLNEVVNNSVVRVDCLLLPCYCFVMIKILPSELFALVRDDGPLRGLIFFFSKLKERFCL